MSCTLIVNLYKPTQNNVAFLFVARSCNNEPAHTHARTRSLPPTMSHNYSSYRTSWTRCVTMELNAKNKIPNVFNCFRWKLLLVICFVLFCFQCRSQANENHSKFPHFDIINARNVKIIFSYMKRPPLFYLLSISRRRMWWNFRYVETKAITFYSPSN